MQCRAHANFPTQGKCFCSLSREDNSRFPEINKDILFGPCVCVIVNHMMAEYELKTDGQWWFESGVTSVLAAACYDGGLASGCEPDGRGNPLFESIDG